MNTNIAENVNSTTWGQMSDRENSALVYGAPLEHWPKDLYIPPDALEVYLSAFSGPLDLLLYLIQRANIDILDIPMALLTEQYLSYVEALRYNNLELAAEYLLMAAVLLEIKSRMLIPRSPRTDGVEEADPRAALVKRLQEYERIKLAAEGLDALPRAHRDFEWAGIFESAVAESVFPIVKLYDMQLAWMGLMKRARVQQHHRIRREELSVREHMSSVLRKLHDNGYVVFESLIDPQQGNAGLVVHFLAVLELARERLIELTQNEAMAPIYMRLTEAHDPS